MFVDRDSVLSQGIEHLRPKKRSPLPEAFPSPTKVALDLEAKNEAVRAAGRAIVDHVVAHRGSVKKALSLYTVQVPPELIRDLAVALGDEV